MEIYRLVQCPKGSEEKLEALIRQKISFYDKIFTQKIWQAEPRSGKMIEDIHFFYAIRKVGDIELPYPAAELNKINYEI